MDLVKDVRAWAAVVAVVIGITLAVTGWANMPDRVAKVEKKTEETQDKVQQLASSVDKYVAVQAEQRKADEEKEKLLIRLIEQVANR